MYKAIFKNKCFSAFFCLFLVLTMAISLFPAAALADDGTECQLDEYTTLFTDANGNELVKNIAPLGPQKPQPAVSDAPVPGKQSIGTTNILTNVPAFSWSYGCSATSAAMLFGYYDRTGYSNFYTGPTNGGVMPLDNSTWGYTTWPSGDYDETPLSATHQGIDGRTTKGHVDDYWVDYGEGSPDPYSGNWAEHTLDSVGDFMGTNQWKFENTDGSTTFWNYNDGTPLYDYTGAEPDSRDGNHGMKLFAESRGYTVTTNYNQFIYGINGNTIGFTYAQFKAEIDAGYPVLIQVQGHTMLGYGYNTSGNLIYIHDTWDHAAHQMTWGGTYSIYNLQHYGVSVIHLDLPPTITVTSPDGGESWNGATSHPITWTSTGTVTNVKIEVSRDSGATWTTIIASTPDDGTYSWTVTGPGTTNARIRISNAPSPSATDTSDADFTIIQSITVTAPNGGETWASGDSQNITWTSVGVTGYVKIEVSRDSGGTWTTVIASTPNDGTYTWAITGAASTTAQIQVSSVTTPATNDTSDADFTIDPAPPAAIMVIVPNGGETWNVGAAKTITWTSVSLTAASTVKIEVSRDSGGTWATVLASTPNDGTQTWVVTGPATVNAQIRITSVSTPAVTDVSDADFIIAQSITVTAPNGGESWAVGGTQNITWTPVGLAATSTVKIEVSRDSGATWTTVIASTPNDGTHPWTLTGYASTTAQIKITSVSVPAVSDTSDADFTITGTAAPTITVTAPNGGENWNVGSAQTITWTSVTLTAANTVKIEVSRDSGATWTTVIASTPNDGTYSWKVTGPGATTAQIRITGATTATSMATDTSDADFTIVQTITVTAPNGAESWTAGTTQTITWTSVGVTGNVKIEVSRDSGATWTTILASTPNDGTQTWKVTGPGATTAQIRITGATTATSMATDTSDADFTIVQTITVTAPNGAESWTAGTNQNITWTSVGITGNVKIQISRDGGATWTTVLASTPNDGTQTWKVTGPGATTAQIKITGATAATASTDTSDANFTIVQSITVTSPNGGESWASGASQTVTWTSVGVTGSVKIQISRDSGATWATVVAATANDGTHTWTLAGYASTTARIKVSSLSTLATNDMSDADFTITGTAAPTITVTAPNGGENWNVGSAQTITWTSTGLTGNVKIEVSRNSGATWTTIIASTPNDGTHPWTVTSPGIATARIRITGATAATAVATDTSDADFTLVQSITVTAPNGAESWAHGTSHAITWTSIGITGSVKIQISRDGGATWTTIIAATANDGTHAWVVTTPASANVLIKITSVSVPAVNDTSDAIFTIT
jgi:hypothetical protein